MLERIFQKRLTLRNLVLSESDKLVLKSMHKDYRKALYNLCEILHLTSYKEEDRISAKKLQELIRKNTLNGKANMCEFDRTNEMRAMERSGKIMKKFTRQNRVAK